MYWYLFFSHMHKVHTKQVMEQGFNNNNNNDNKKEPRMRERQKNADFRFSCIINLLSNPSVCILTYTIFWYESLSQIHSSIFFFSLFFSLVVHIKLIFLYAVSSFFEMKTVDVQHTRECCTHIID